MTGDPEWIKSKRVPGKLISKKTAARQNDVHTSSGYVQGAMTKLGDTYR